MRTWCVNSGRRSAALGLAALLAGCASAPGPRRDAVVSSLPDDTARDIAVHALGLVGTPYRYGGNTPDGGFDCSGLILYVFRSSGAPMLPPRTVAQLHRWGRTVPRDALRTGDLVLVGAGSTPTHAGIYVGEERFVHAPSSGGTVRMDSLVARHWARQQVTFRRP